MDQSNAVLAGRIEDKWIEFVVAEFSARPRRPLHQARAAACIQHVEVQAGYLWLLAGAIVAWWIC